MLHRLSKVEEKNQEQDAKIRLKPASLSEWTKVRSILMNHWNRRISCSEDLFEVYYRMKMFHIIRKDTEPHERAGETSL